MSYNRHTRQAVAAAIAKRQEIWNDVPLHPAVDWKTLRMLDGRMQVEITCPFCKVGRFDDASQVKYRIRKGTFTGQCYKDRLIRIERIDRKIPLTPHPQVDWLDTAVIRKKTQRLTHVGVTCPDCKAKRYEPRNAVANHISSNRFTGRCSICSGRANWTPFEKLGPGRSVDTVRGYVRLTRGAINEKDLGIFIPMQGRLTFVFEHRFVMAKALGRALNSNELVDHMDGVKTNNDITNLRLYARGKNQPGETSGYGTYYHEWQLALSKIRLLEYELDRLKHR